MKKIIYTILLTLLLASVISISFADTPPDMKYTISSQSGPNGNISPANNITVSAGEDVEFIITPDAGYRVKDVLVDGVSVGRVDYYIFTNVESDRTISATFEKLPNRFQVDASAGPNGRISDEGVTYLYGGSQFTYHIVADSGYRIKAVEVDGVDVGAVKEYTFYNVNENHTIMALFEKKPVYYSVQAIQPDNGSITPKGVKSYEKGERVEYIISANPGYHIKSVIIDGRNIGVGTRAIFTNIDSSHVIEAVMEKNDNSYTITATNGQNGSITPSGLTQVAEGESMTYNIAPSSGYHIKDVIVDGVSVGPISRYTFINIVNDHTIEAVFEKDVVRHSIEAIKPEHGSISPSGIKEYVEGSSVIYRVEADEGYSIKNLIVDGVKKGPIEEYKFENITGPHTISAHFVKDITMFKVKAVAGDGGTITPEGTSEYAQGSSATYVIKPDKTYRVKELKVDGLPIGIVDKYVFESINAHREIEVTFEKKEDNNLEDGDYEVSAEFKDVSDISKSTVIKNAIKSSSVSVKQGKLNLTTKLKTFKIDGYDRNISRIKYYVDGLDSELKEPVTISYGDKVISFQLPIKSDKKGVYLKVYIDSIGFNLNTYMLVNLSNVKKVAPKKLPRKRLQKNSNEDTTPPESKGGTSEDEDLNENQGSFVDIEEDKSNETDKSKDNKDDSIISDKKADKENDKTEEEDKITTKEYETEKSDDSKVKKNYAVQLEGDETSGPTSVTAITIGLFSLLVVVGYFLFSAKR